MLKLFGFSEEWIHFFNNYLSPEVLIPFSDNSEKPRKLERGILLGHALSKVISELLLYMMDIYIYQNSGVKTIRIVDDIYAWKDETSITKAYEAARDFLNRCMLKINVEKSGYVCIGKETVGALLIPHPIRWGLLELRNDGIWQADMKMIKRITESLVI